MPHPRAGSIRRKLGVWRDCIETVRGVGYRYDDEAAASRKTPPRVAAQR